MQAPESFELENDVKNPLIPRNSLSDLSDDSNVDYFDPLTDDEAPYTDNAHPSNPTIYTEKWPTRYSSKPLAWQDPAQTRPRWKRYLIPSRFCCILTLLFTGGLFLLLTAGGIWVYHASVPPYGHSPPHYPSPRGGTLPSWHESYRKAAALVAQMTLVEKVNLTTGTGWRMGPCVGNTGSIPRLDFPSLCLQDGPLGLRFIPNTTAWPAALTVGATWSKTLMYQRGRAHGFEAKKKGINILLGPSMGPIGRLPAGGRNWEGFGADPVLQGIGAAQTIRGIQNVGVMATAKHWVGNEQEHFRQARWVAGLQGEALSSNIDDRALHELYAWPFAESVRAGVAGVMCSYNQVNNSYACQNSKLLNGVLKDEMGFQGFVMSDWLAQRSGVASALAGLDMSMPGDGLAWEDGKSLWGAELTKAVLNSSVPVERLDDMAMRIVAAWYQSRQDMPSEWPKVSEGGGPNFSSWTDDETGLLYPGSPGNKETGVVNKNVPVRQTSEDGDHDVLARQIAAEGIVLVKNEGGILPLSRDASEFPPKSGGGRTKVGVFGEDAFPNPNGINACEDRGCNEGTLTMGWGSGAAELPYLSPPVFALITNFDSEKVEMAFWAENEDPEVQQAAAEQDLCFVFINSDAGEGFISWNGVNGDRNDLYAQKSGDELVRRVAENCENTIVVLHTVGPTLLEEWIDMPGVKAVLIAHLPGQESGNAVADVVFGDVNPSGRLPYTIAKAEEDYGPTSKVMYYPNAVVPQQNFTEGLYIDYRYFDKQGITPRYEFGYGLSYTDFKLNSLMVHPLGLPDGEPQPRPEGVEPPQLETTIPPPESAIWPTGLRKVKKFIYPYLTDTTSLTRERYDYPEGYSTTPKSPSKAGGGEGGNPDLYRTAVTIRASITNLGATPGLCVVQLYLTFPPDIRSPYTGEPIDTPVKVLRNFDKVYIGSSLTDQKRKEVSLDLTRKDLSYWDVGAQNWILPPGEFVVHLGFSSRDLPLVGKFENRLLNFGSGEGAGGEGVR